MRKPDLQLNLFNKEVVPLTWQIDKHLIISVSSKVIEGRGNDTELPHLDEHHRNIITLRGTKCDKPTWHSRLELSVN